MVTNDEQRRLAMALKSVFAFSVIFLLAYCEAKPENCSVTRCKLLPVGEGFTSEFYSKASEKGVRLVYLNLKIGNDSYDPLELQDVFLPHRWVWTNTISEPMLSLSYDYDILSLGLLTHQERSMEVHLQDQPSGCLVNLNSTCQNLAVGRMLLENVTMGTSDELLHEAQVVCVAVIEIVDIQSGLLKLSVTKTEINYHCCGVKEGPNRPSILCDRTVHISTWLNRFRDSFYYAMTTVMTLFLPALPLALPDCVFSLRSECDKESRSKQRNNRVGLSDQQDNTGEVNHNSNQEINRTSERNSSDNIIYGYEQSEEESKLIPVDDASPMTLSTLLLKVVQKFPDGGRSFNIRLAFMLFCVFPCLVYVQMGLYRTFKKTYNSESIKKDLPLSIVFSRPNMLLGVVTTDLTIFFFVAFEVTSLMLVLFLRPKDFISKGKCALCSRYFRGWCDDEFNLPKTSERFLGDEIRLHLKMMHHLLWKSILLFVKGSVFGYNISTCLCMKMTQHQLSRRKRALYVLWNLVIILPSLFVAFVINAFCLIILLVASASCIVSLSPFVSLFFSAVSHNKTEEIQTSIETETESISEVKESIFQAITTSILIAVGILFFVTISWLILLDSSNFIISATEYTFMGLVLNMDSVTPYVAFVLVSTTNIYLCYANMQNKYREIKKMIFKRQKELHINNGDPEGTIRTQLFWFVCDRVLPIKSEICRMLRNMVLVSAFFLLVVYSIVLLGNEYHVSAVFSAIYVFFSGVIAAKALKEVTKGNKFKGWEKIEIEREIETAVIEYRN